MTDPLAFTILVLFQGVRVPKNECEGIKGIVPAAADVDSAAKSN